MINPPEIINTGRLTLRRPRISDADDIYNYASDPDVVKYVAFKRHQSPVDAINFLNYQNSLWNEAKGFGYAICLKDSEKLIGMIDIRFKNNSAGFGYILNKQFWKKGIMSEALTILVSWSLQQPKIFRADALCDSENPASARVMEKAGMSKEGLLKRWSVHPNISDEPRDCYIYSKTK
jgi:ribosomal-protein-alanine N-acetyltransferase